MKTLSNEEKQELIIKCWMTHDSLWFLHSLRKNGIETTNKINIAASKGLGLIEAKRFKRVLGITEFKTFDEIKDFFNTMVTIVKAEFMKFSYVFLNENEIQFEMHQCFAHDGIKRIGVIDQYQCGIYERIEGWLEGLGIKYKVLPQISGCLIHQGKKCIRKYTLLLPQIPNKN